METIKSDINKIFELLKVERQRVPLRISDDEFQGRTSFGSNAAKFQKIDVLKKFIRDDPKLN